MTNRKIKDYPKNVILHRCILENWRNLARIMLTLNRLYPKQFYPKKMQEWLEGYADNCREMDKLEAVDAYDYKMAEWCEEYGIDTTWCVAFVKKNSPSIKIPMNIEVLANNIKLALVQTCSEFGIGDKRLGEIKAALEEKQPTEPERELTKFGIEFEPMTVGQLDYRKLLPQKQKKASYTDIKRGYEGLAKLKAYQDDVRGGKR